MDKFDGNDESSLALSNENSLNKQVDCYQSAFTATSGECSSISQRVKWFEKGQIYYKREIYVNQAKVKSAIYSSGKKLIGASMLFSQLWLW